MFSHQKQPGVGKIRFSGERAPFCSPFDSKKYTCSTHHVPRRVPKEIDYGKHNVETSSSTASSTRATLLTWRH